MKLPTDVARNHTPIIKPPMRAGASIGHRAQADGTQHQLADRVQEVGGGQPHRAGQLALSACAGTNQDHEAETDEAPGPMRTWSAPTARCRAAAILTQTHAMTGAKRIRKNEFMRLEPAARETACRARCCSVLRSANRLSVDPACSNTDQNNDGRQEQHADHIEALALLGRPFARGIQPAEESDDDEQQEHAGGVGDLRRGNRHESGVAANADDQRPAPAARRR